MGKDKPLTTRPPRGQHWIIAGDVDFSISSHLTGVCMCAGVLVCAGVSQFAFLMKRKTQKEMQPEERTKDGGPQ